MDLEAALARLADWAADVTKSSSEREEELIARQNREALAEIESRMGIPRGRGLA
jgi:hypothetical protein